MTADGTPGSKNQPQFLGSGAPATAADLNTVSNYAAGVGNFKALTTAARTALSGADRWEGLHVFDTDTDTLYVYDGSGWVRVYDIGAYPYAIAQGVVTCPTVGGGGTSGGIGWSALIDVTFPAGRFAVAPHVRVQTIGPSAQVVVGGMYEQVTTSGCKVRGIRVGSEPSEVFSVQWTAIQMAAASAVG